VSSFIPVGDALNDLFTGHAERDNLIWGNKSQAKQKKNKVEIDMKKKRRRKTFFNIKISFTNLVTKNI
jgi:hypothetical protein